MSPTDSAAPGAAGEPIATDALVIGAGPAGLFQVFELGLLGVKAHVVDTLRHPGGQCAELYPDKPIYDIPALPVCGAQELVDRLLEQIKPFGATFHFGQEVVSLSRQGDGTFLVGTSAGTRFLARTVVVAAGLGSFQPRRLGVEGADAFEDRQVHYRVRNAADFHGQRLVIFGGGDSALDWVLDLHGKAKSIVHVHRRPEFRAAPASVARMKDLVAAGAMTYVEGTAAALLKDGDRLVGITVKRSDGSTVDLEADHVLAFFGLHPKLGPIAEWGMELDKKALKVDTAKFQTSVPGIFAIGDINTYPGKKKLILSGFHEAALAAFAIAEHLNPAKKVHLQYTTTSPIMQKRL
ncbi:MAG TPA: NAD(P)/FAD-dependent oxidoreductase, partial [Steroidobacteraceae bacterium]|nr:NAD(P)/FAD-dependent oxidoreductase [Steroidobacteraceae bacterium]